jgi:hypothetical protein
MPISHAVWTVSTEPNEIPQGILPSEQMLEEMIVAHRTRLLQHISAWSADDTNGRLDGPRRGIAMSDEGPPSINSRIACPIFQAVFWYTPRRRAITTEEIPLLDVSTMNIAEIQIRRSSLVA